MANRGNFIDPIFFAWVSLHKTPFPTSLGEPVGNKGHYERVQRTKEYCRNSSIHT